MTPIPIDLFEQLKCLDTCSASNAIEQFNVRTRNEGFVSGAVRCRFPHLPPMLGYAATARVRTSSTPVRGRPYYDRMDFWTFLTSVPEPRVLVLQDVDPNPGLGALVGEIHATIAQALRCTGCVTNGAVRDLAPVEALGFSMFSRRLSVSHAYAHIVDFGNPVEIGGLPFQPGDLVHGDRNGVHIIPREVADAVPQVARKLQQREDELTSFCRSDAFSLQELAKRMHIAASEIMPPSPAVKL